MKTLPRPESVAMRLLHDLWTTAPRRTSLVAGLVLLGSLGQTLAAALTGDVLVRRSGTAFTLLSLLLVLVVVSDLSIHLVAARLTADWASDVRQRLCRATFGRSLPDLDDSPVGELLDRIDGDVAQVGSQLRGNTVRIAQGLVTGLLSIVVALVLWWPAGLLMGILGGAVTAGLARRTRRIAPARVREEEAWSELAAVVEEAVHGQDDIRTSLARPYVLGLYARRAAGVLRRGMVVWRLSAQVTLAASAIVRTAVALVVLGGTWALSAGWIDAARLTSLWLLAIGFSRTVEHLSRMVPELQYALGAWDRVRLLAEAPQEPRGGTVPGDGKLDLRGLTFTYPGAAPRTALRDLRLTLVPGRSYALIGRTGSGKSTLAKALTRTVELPRGQVFLGGTDLAELDPELLRRRITLVPQRTEILAGSLAENVALFDPELLDTVPTALRDLGLDPWVATLPQGLDTRLGDGGLVLSAGQEQLVAFARILVRDPAVVILDEATARLDPVTEAVVRTATERLLVGRIGLLIAHRLSSVQHCDEVIVLADGAVAEAGPLTQSRHFARLLAESGATPVTDGPPGGAGATALRSRPPSGADLDRTSPRQAATPQARAPRVRTLREILRLVVNDPRLGLGAVALFGALMIFGPDGALLPWLWSDLVDGHGPLGGPAALISLAVLGTVPLRYHTSVWFPQWWARQMLRINLRLVHGQTGPGRIGRHTPAEVVAQGGDTERVVMLADHVVDQAIGLVLIVAMTVVTGSAVPGYFFAGTMLTSGLAAAAFGPWLKHSARRTVTARARFATALGSAVAAVRSVKLAGATPSVLAHLAALDARRSEHQRAEIAVQVWARSAPSILAGLLPIGAWSLYLLGTVSAGATLVTVSALTGARWFAWTTASLVSQLPSARVWTRRTTAMCGVSAYSSSVPGVDLAAGTAPAPPVPPRARLDRLELVDFGVVHDDGRRALQGLDLTVRRGDLILVIGQVGAGKSSLLRALAGLVPHTGSLLWNGLPVTEPEVFLRPNQVGYVAQLPRVLSGSVADNIGLGHDVDPVAAVATAQLDADLDATGHGLGLLIGHKGTRLSGGQLQRLALARALAPATELLLADDVSSALDLATEVQVWKALRLRRVTVIGATSKRVALAQADLVVVLHEGQVVAIGAWDDVRARWGHLAG